MVRVSLASQLRLAALGMACAGAASLAFAPSASAFRPNEASLQLEILPGTEQFQFMYRSADLANDADVQSYTAQLHGELGSAWKVTSWNQYSGTARSVQGPGIVLASEGLASASEDRVESLARGFIAEHAALFATDGSNLVLQKIGHGAERWGVIFQQQLDGVTVQGTQVILAMHDNGRLFAFGSDLYPDVYVPFADQVDLVAARQIARDAVPYDPTLEYEIGPDARVIVPVMHGRGDIDYHMTHRTDVPVREPLGVYRTWVDAVTGEIVYRENQVEFAYEGTTSGDVEVFSPCDGDSPDTPHPHMTVNIDGVGSVDTDDDGNFSIAGNAGTRNFNAAFDGPDFNVNCNGCGGDAVFNGTIDPDTPEAIYYDVATFRPDERDAFHFCNRIKLYVQGIDPDFTQNKYTVNVNVSGCCNANWNGTVVNFYREGCGCANMARVSDVVVHEFGHGIQNWCLGGGQGPQGLGEGNADITSTFNNDNSIVGIGVTDCVSGARYCDNALVYPDDLNGQVHHDGQIICGFNWDVRRNLIWTLGGTEAKAHTAELWHFARKLFMTSANNQPDQAERYIWVDDDNGNLDDGTPNYDQICAARDKHGYGECAPIIVGVEGDEPVGASLGLRLFSANPNPLGASTSIRYSLASDSRVELAIYDAGGRIVRTLVDEARSAGQHVADWDGKDADGNAVSSGTYFYRLQVGDWQQTRSLTVVK